MSRERRLGPNADRALRDLEDFGFSRDPGAAEPLIDPVTGRNSGPGGGNPDAIRRDARRASKEWPPKQGRPFNVPGYSMDDPSAPGAGVGQSEPTQPMGQSQPTGVQRPNRWDQASKATKYMDRNQSWAGLVTDALTSIGGSIDRRVARRAAATGLGGPSSNGEGGAPFSEDTQPVGAQLAFPGMNGYGGSSNNGSGPPGIVPGPFPQDPNKATTTPWATKLPVSFAVARAAVWGQRSFPRFKSQENLALLYSPSNMDAGRVYTQHAYMRPTRRMTEHDREFQFNVNESEQQQWANLPPPVYRENRPVSSSQQPIGSISDGVPDWNVQAERNRHLDVLHENLTGNPYGYDSHTRATAGYDTPNPATIPGIRAPRRSE